MEADALSGRIDAEFARSKAKMDNMRQDLIAEYKGRQDRLALFVKACESLQDVWKPRLEGLKRAFGEKVQVTPRVETGRRQATFSFASSLAHISLNFTATTDQDVRKLVLESSMDVVPVLMALPGRSVLEQPFDRIDREATGAWVEDRIVEFVRAYLDLHENEYYLKAHMVEDPVAHVRFPEFAAATTLERGGKTLYFIANETRERFEAEERRKSAG
ncbi:MAG TPA: hypothetical protein VF950_05265 [Planctomycetota bacterium]